MSHRYEVLGVVLLALAGCATTQTSRFVAEEEPERDPLADVKTIGDVTSVANADSVVLSGVGLVVGLNGTGGGAPPGTYRQILEADLKKKGVDNIKEILNSNEVALVLVSAMIPAGCHKGDPIDVEVTLPPQSKAVSLRGGYLKECVLYNYDSTRNVSPGTQRADQMMKGHPLATAEGALLVGFGDGDEAAQLKRGRIWGGGKSAIDRPFYLALNSDQQYVRVAMRVAERVNETFQGQYRGAGSALAEAKTKTVVYLKVPAQYKHNLPRYLRVVRLIPLQEAPNVNSSYRKKLEENLLDPAKTITTALRLEGLGTDSIDILKTGLKSSHALVRFTSAEALAYLGSPACGEELTKLVQDKPVLRSYCLTALASLDEAICHVKLRELLSSSSAETRYGAFRALRALDDRDPTVRGEQLNESFWLHRVAPDAAPLVHFSTSRRPEVVVFGEEPVLDPPFSFRAGPDFVVSASRDDQRCTITRITLESGTKRKQCSLKLSDVLKNLADLGGQYPDVVELLQQADRIQCLNCPVAVDALPMATSIYKLAQANADGEDGAEADDAELVKARPDFGATPTLFEDGNRRKKRPDPDGAAGAGGE